MQHHKKNNHFLSFLMIFILAFSGGNYWAIHKEEIIEKYSNQEKEAPSGKLEELDSEKKSELNFDAFENVWEVVKDKYVDPQIFSENEPFEYGIIKGLVSGLNDPYSVFMTPEENQDFREGLEGNFQGIGAELTVKSGAIIVVTPLKKSPAKKAGLMPEDIILKVDGKDIIGQPLREVVSKIRGPKGSDVTLGVFRPKEVEEIDITITRDVILLSSVESEMKEDIAYVEINQFGDDTTLEFAKQIRELYKKNPKGIILDLRFNGGGYLDGAVDIASAFLEKNMSVVEVKSKESSITHRSKYKIFSDSEIPMGILINKGSASASEIVAGALKDHKRAVIIGEQSFGKGTVQEVVPLKGGASLRITIAKWLTPNGNTIDKTGISPDILIEKTREDFEEERTPQLDRALEIIKESNWKSFMTQQE
ncbi:S41 family peptidase [Candidatus Peregrinibacteria bacterium]|jgi:carboxyl-terminal processing protease|nr:S41 family peptidase [Candidatus Peregrinibacteria bacterium]